MVCRGGETTVSGGVPCGGSVDEDSAVGCVLVVLLCSAPRQVRVICHAQLVKL